MIENGTILANNQKRTAAKSVSMEMVEIEGEAYYKIENHNAMRPFFMSIVSSSDHWLFVSSNGGLTAGRKNANFALFPYYTDDKVTEFADITGSKTIIQVRNQDQIQLWEPFSDRFNDRVQLTRNLYKSFFGDKIIFEEVHHNLRLTFRYQWSTSDRFGFIKKSEIVNDGNAERQVTFVDGIQNVMPYGVSSDLQTSTSNLVDAYKRNELHAESGIGIFALSAIIVDKAEPSEALKANIAWSTGIKNPTYLLSSMQLAAFRAQQKVTQEIDIKGEKGAYFITSDLELAPKSSKRWSIIANVNVDQSHVLELADLILKDPEVEAQLAKDVALGNRNLVTLNGTADGIQCTADKRRDARHFSNVLFNIMRGGVFDANYQIEKKDFLLYLSKANKPVFEQFKEYFKSLSDIFQYAELKQFADNFSHSDLQRLCTEYLPLKFSRRHGDPSRPWNKFSINTRSEIDGSKILDYEGNWRDIFQNWEGLAHAFPEFIDGMIHKFLNASTFDGYNPYRVTKSGFDWEVIEYDNPWSYIGYWGDHQIIYLLKFLEFIEKHEPGKLHGYFENECFVYAAVPYRIKSYQEIIKNPKDTISYNDEWDQKVAQQKAAIGADGALLTGDHQQIYHVNFIEKILATVLAKMSNFIPEGGIWMNTQRPEWNDANNALVGNGVSMVTLYYLHRFLKFFQELLNESKSDTIKISSEMVEFYHTVRETLMKYRPLLSASITNLQRKEIMDALGMAASDYRSHVYKNGFWGKKGSISMSGLKAFVEVSLDFMAHSIEANKRQDHLYHAYNLMEVKGEGVEISYLPEMLEGQVAILSSNYINGEEAIRILDSLRNSSLYRADQNSYILYPNKELPGFLHKNTLARESVEKSKLLTEMLRRKDTRLVKEDIHGAIHFNGNFHNAGDVAAVLSLLEHEKEYGTLVAGDTEFVLQIFEAVFNHKAFTGRSGTFFAYEGLGSIYWHMISKLHLAVQEVCLKSIQNQEDHQVVAALKNHYLNIGEGIGVHKNPDHYGAFPTDPYSHTPLHRGAQQPGMTGQVKEDILTRIGELGVQVSGGRLKFIPRILSKKEFLAEQEQLELVSVTGSELRLTIEKGCMAFTVCQVPVIYRLADVQQMEVHYAGGAVSTFQTAELDETESQKVFERTGEIVLIKVDLIGEQLIG